MSKKIERDVMLSFAFNIRIYALHFGIWIDPVCVSRFGVYRTKVTRGWLIKLMAWRLNLWLSWIRKKAGEQ